MKREYTIYHDMPFGKYKGELIGTVIETDHPYIFWALNSTEFRLDDEGMKYLEECSE